MDSEDGVKTASGDLAMAAGARSAGLRSIPSFPARNSPAGNRNDDETIADLLDSLNIDDAQTVKVAVMRQSPSGRYVSLPAIEITPDMREEGLQLDQLIGHQFRKAGQYKWRLLVSGKYRKGGSFLIGQEFEEADAPLDDEAFAETRHHNPPPAAAMPVQDLAAAIATAVTTAIAPLIQAAAKPPAPGLDLGNLIREIKDSANAQVQLVQSTMQSQQALMMKLIEGKATAPAQPVSPPSLAQQLTDLADASDALDRIRGRSGSDLDPGDDDDDDIEDDDDRGALFDPPARETTLTERVIEKGSAAVERALDTLLEQGEQKLAKGLSEPSPSPAVPGAGQIASSAASISLIDQAEELISTFEQLAEHNVPYAHIRANIIARLSPEQQKQLQALQPDFLSAALETSGRSDLAKRVQNPKLKKYLEKIQTEMRAGA